MPTMRAAFTVLTDRMLVPLIMSFQPGLPYAFLQFEPEVYAAEARLYSYAFEASPENTSHLRHALLTKNWRMVDLLFRMHEQPYYAAMPFLTMDHVQELVCQRVELVCQRVEHLQLLHDKSDVFTVWPGSLLRATIAALENPHPKPPPEDQAAFDADQKNKAQWLLDHHSEACTELIEPSGILLSSLEHRDMVVTLLDAGAVNLSAFGGYLAAFIDVPLLELLLQKYPAAITRAMVESCAASGNLAAVKFIHDHASELPDGLFTAATMDAAAKANTVEVVRFLHENRTEGCTTRAMDKAAMEGNLEVVRFLQENRTEGCTQWAMRASAIHGHDGKGDVEMVKYLVAHRPELIVDPTTWEFNDAVKYLCSVWAKSATTSEDPVLALRAAVVELVDLDEFKRIHDQKHPAGCVADPRFRPRCALLSLAINMQKGAFASYLVENCGHIQASIDFEDVAAAGSDTRPLNLELLHLLLEKMPRNENTDRFRTDQLRFAAKDSNLPVVKALLECGVPCSEDIMMEGLYGGFMDVPTYLMDKYPELITRDVMKQVAYRGEHECFYKLCASHPHLVDSSVVEEILCGENSPAYTTWEVLRFLHEHFPHVTVEEEKLQWVWEADDDDVLVFMWLVWSDPYTASSLATADRFTCLRLYYCVRACVPSLFAEVPSELPWCCQLRLLRQRVESGELTLEDVERARNEAAMP